MTRRCFICDWVDVEFYSYINKGGTEEQWNSKYVKVLCCDCVKIIKMIRKGYEIKKVFSEEVFGWESDIKRVYITEKMHKKLKTIGVLE